MEEFSENCSLPLISVSIHLSQCVPVNPPTLRELPSDSLSRSARKYTEATHPPSRMGRYFRATVSGTYLVATNVMIASAWISVAWVLVEPHARRLHNPEWTNTKNCEFAKVHSHMRQAVIISVLEVRLGPPVRRSPCPSSY